MMGGGKFSTFNSSWTLTPFLIKSAIIVFPLRSEKKGYFTALFMLHYVIPFHLITIQNLSSSIQGGGLASVRELQTHNSTSSDERSSPRSDYFSKESSIASTEHRQTLTMSTASHQITHGMQSMNTVGLPQANARKKPSEIAAKPFMVSS